MLKLWLRALLDHVAAMSVKNKGLFKPNISVSSSDHTKKEYGSFSIVSFRQSFAYNDTWRWVRDPLRASVLMLMLPLTFGVRRPLEESHKMSQLMSN